MTRPLPHVCILIACVVVPLRAAAEPQEQQQLIAVLLSDKPLHEKDVACTRLKQIGAAAAVPALAALLPDALLSHSARHALESMPFPEAGKALREALAQTAGTTKAGVLDSLGARGQRDAIPDVVPLLADPEPLVASAAAAALGRMGGAESAQALRTALTKAAGSARLLLADSILRCADGLLTSGDARAAAALYQGMSARGEPEHVRVAAFRGLILASGDGAASKAAGALKSRDGAARTAALHVIREIPGEPATRAFAEVLPKVSPEVQVALIEALSQRGEAAAQKAIVAATRSPAYPVRVTSLEALGELGDASVVPLLAERAAAAAGDEQEAARRALAALRRGDVRGAMLALLDKAKPPVRVELIKGFAGRGDTQTLPSLLKAARDRDEQVQVAAAEALAALAGEGEVGALITLLVGAKSDPLRDAAETAIVSVSHRSEHPGALSTKVLAAREGASVSASGSLLRAAGRIGGSGVLEALRASVRDPEPTIRDTALRTMADYAGTEALPDLLALAGEASSPTHRVLALRGYWRLVALLGDRSAEDRLALCQAGLAVAKRPEERRAGLAELAKVGLPEALEVAKALRGEAAVTGEAELACVQIATRLLGRNPVEADATLRSLLADSESEDVRAAARGAFEALQRLADYVRPWLMAGPYREDGKEAQALFDVTFTPETAAGDQVDWRPATTPQDPLLFWQVDIPNAAIGNHCVMYLKTRVYAPREQAVRLDIGTDDGIKLWVNGELVHANNAVRGLTPDQDQASATLKLGWNDFFAKITQHTVGCGACVRIRTPDGAKIEGLRTDPQGGMD